jgi:hypothetical protein
MAGVAEFTLGFGLLWTPLVRRLSAIALFVIFNAAVFPFGRVDLIGHALIMAIIVAIAADHTRELHVFRRSRESVVGVPAALAIALVVFAAGYWGAHAAIYGVDEQQAGAPPKTTHTYDPDHPHPAPGGPQPGVPPTRP